MAQQIFEYSPSSELMQSSPKVLITLFLLGRYNHYLDQMDNPDGLDLDSATAALLSTLPNAVLRDKLFKDYVERKKDSKIGGITASLLTSGDWFAHISEVLEFTETSAGAF